jgi:hypothetical protein
MLEITNKNKFPVQLVVRSKTEPKAFTTLNVPGIGAGMNVIVIEDEKHTEYVDRMEQMGLISVRRFNKKKGE